MMKAEFEAMAGKSVTDEEYKVLSRQFTPGIRQSMTRPVRIR